MPDLDRIEVRLTAQISDFQRAMQAAGKDVDAFGAKGQKAGAATANLAKSTDAGAKSTSTYAEMVRQGYQIQEQLTRSQTGVIRGLERQIAAQRLSGRELAVYTALQRARTSVDTEAGRVIAALAVRHHDAANATKATVAVTQDLRARATAATGSLGLMGSALLAVGPAGIVAGVAIAGLSLGIHQAVQAANQLADSAGKMVDFAETTGLTTTQLQALQKAGAMVGVEADKIGSGFERFSSQLEELRRGSGQLYDGLNRINPALTRQLAVTRDAGEAWNVLSLAIAAASREQGLALSRAAVGQRNAGGFFRLANETANAGGTAGLEASLGQINTLTQEQLKHWDELKDRIDFTTRLARQNIASIFTTRVLETQLKFAEGMLGISQAARNFTLSGDWSRLMSDLNGSGIQNLINFAQAMPIIGPGLALAARAATAGRGVTTPEQSVPAASFNDRFNAATGSLRRDDPMRLDRFDAANLQRQVAAMGEAASSADRLRLAEMQLAIAAKEAGLSQEQYNRALAAMRSAEALSDLRDMISALGSAATVTELQEYRLAQLGRQLQLGKIDWDTYARAVAGARRDFDLQRERDRVNALGDAATETDRYALRVSELERKLEQVRISQETFNRALIAAHPLFNQLTDAAGNFFNTLAQGFAQTGNLGDALRSSLKGLGSELTGIGTRNLQQGIKSSASSLLSGGGLTGFDPVSLGIGAAGMALSLFMGQSEKKKQEEERLKRAQEEWRKMQDRLLEFSAVLTGGAVGAVTHSLRETTAQLLEFSKAAYEARDMEGLQQLQSDFTTFVRRTVDGFVNSFDVTVEAFERSLGDNSPFLRAVENVKGIGDKLKGFVSDTQTIFAMVDGIRLTRSNTSFSGTGDPAMQVAQAQAAAQAFALSLLQAAPELSVVATRLLEIEGTAKQLEVTLTELGMTSGAAGRAVAEGVTAAVRALRDKFSDDISREINEASGRGFVNEITDLIARRNQMVQDAQALGADADLLNGRWFQVMAQRIVDGADLAGAGFNELLDLFPELSGVISESARALEDASRAERERIDQLNQHGRSVVTYLLGLQTGSGSALSPRARLNAAQSAFDATNTLAQGGNLDALSRWTQEAEALRTAAQDMFGSAGGYQAILQQIVQRGTGLPAVATSPDPIVNALLSVVQEIQTTNSTLQGTILAALQTGSAQNIATALSQHFDRVDTSVNGLIDVNEFNAAVGPLAKNVDLVKVFQELDGNGNGVLERAELLRTATNAVGGSVNNVGSAVGGVEQAANRTRDEVRANTTVANDTYSIEQAQQGLLAEIKSLNSTAATQLTLLQSQYSSSAISAGSDGRLTGFQRAIQNTSVENNMLTALNKIVANTAVIARQASGSTLWWLSEGGWIGGGIPGKDSVRGMLMPDEFVVKATSATAPGIPEVLEHINRFGQLPDIMPAVSIPAPAFAGANDNGALLAEVRRLNDNVFALRQENALMQAQIARLTVKQTEAVTAGQEKQTRDLKSGDAQEKRGQRARNLGRNKAA